MRRLLTSVASRVLLLTPAVRKSARTSSTSSSTSSGSEPSSSGLSSNILLRRLRRQYRTNTAAAATAAEQCAKFPSVSSKAVSNQRFEDFDREPQNDQRRKRIQSVQSPSNRTLKKKVTFAPSPVINKAASKMDPDDIEGVSLSDETAPSLTTAKKLELDPQSKTEAATTMPPSFDRGVFQTLPNDGTMNQKMLSGGSGLRAGFDRLIQFQIAPDLWLFGVIDGHGQSSLCAEYLYEAFPIVIQLLLNNTERKNEEDGESGDDDDTFYLDILREAFRVCAQEWDKSAPKTTAGVDHDRRHSGAVALMVLVKGSKCYVANAGDCRAVASDGDGTFHDVHELHRTDNPQERARVINKGGRIRTVNGILRVQGSLMPTRAFGDINVRTDFLGNLQDFVAPEPDIAVVEPDPEGQGKHGKAYMLMGSDGLWDALDDDTISKMVREGLTAGRAADDIAQELGRNAAVNTHDDVSVILLVW